MAMQLMSPPQLVRLTSVSAYNEWSFAECAEWGHPEHGSFIEEADSCLQPAGLESVSLQTPWVTSVSAHTGAAGCSDEHGSFIEEADSCPQPDLGRTNTHSAYNEWSCLEEEPWSLGQAEAASGPQPAWLLAHLCQLPLPAASEPASPEDEDQQLQPDSPRRRGGRSRRSYSEQTPGPATDLQTEQRLSQLLHGSADERSLALEELQGRVWSMSCEKQGCRIVQDAIEQAPPAKAIALVKELRGHVQEALVSPNANFVIQRIIEKLPASESEFIAREVLAKTTEVACHRFGCRAIIRLIEHTAATPSTAALTKDILEACVYMSCHKFGRHVVLAMMEQSEEHRHQVALKLERCACAAAKNRDGSYVIEKALQLCSREDQDALATALVGGGGAGVLELAKDEFACFVVRALASMSATTKQQQLSRQVLEEVSAVQAELNQSRSGARLVKDLKSKLEAVAHRPR